MGCLRWCKISGTEKQSNDPQTQQKGPEKSVNANSPHPVNSEILSAVQATPQMILKVMAAFKLACNLRYGQKDMTRASRAEQGILAASYSYAVLPDGQNHRKATFDTLPRQRQSYETQIRNIVAASRYCQGISPGSVNWLKKVYTKYQTCRHARVVDRERSAQNEE